MRLSRRSLYIHREPLLRRSDVSLPRELQGPPLPTRRLARAEARRILELIVDTSAMRYRELYGFSHPDESGVFHADLGRGVDLFYFGVPPAWRLPLRAYHGGLFFKNGVPAGYVELLSLFERAEVGFNLYYTFREGESAWLYARLLRLFHQVLGVTCFSVDPYQIGLENPEAVDSGAFWFYRKMGFRPVDPAVHAVMEREEARIRRTPGYHTSHATLEKLARGYILYEAPSSDPGAWDNFTVRRLGQAVQRAAVRQFGDDPQSIRESASRGVAAALGCESSNAFAIALSTIPNLSRWTADQKLAARRIVEAKDTGSETRYLRLMQRHPRLRAAFLKWGSSAPTGRPAK